jgi:hypothetical protein
VTRLLDAAIADLQDARLLWRHGHAADALARILSAAVHLKRATSMGVEGALS